MVETLLHDTGLFLPEIALTLTFLVGILTDLVFKRSRVAVAGVTLAGFITTGVLVLSQAGVEALIFGNMVAVDPFAYFFKLVIILSAILILVFSLSSAELNSPGRKLGEYYALLSALTLGMMLMAAERPPFQSFLLGPSTVFCVAV